MFWKESRVAELERQVKSLRERLEKAEIELAPFRVGELPPYWWEHGFYMRSDPRPTITHARLLRMIMDHVGVKLRKTDAVPEVVSLEKVSR